MSVEIAWKQNILVTDSYLLKSLLVVFGLGLQAFVCDFSRQNICSVDNILRQIISRLNKKIICKIIKDTLLFTVSWSLHNFYKAIVQSLSGYYF